MKSGSISYSPDYESGASEEWQSGDYGDFLELSSAERAIVEIRLERARLEREVVETCKAARSAEHKYTKALTVGTWEAMVAAQVLRDSAVDALLAFEAEAEKKS